MKLLIRFSLCLFFLAALGAQADVVDRKPLLEAAYQMFPGLIKNFSQLELVESKLDIKQREIINRMREQVQGPMPKLVYVRDQSQFIIEPDPVPRLMRTPDKKDLESGAENVIYINEEMLEDLSKDIDYLLLNKFIFHEISHQIGVDDLGLRDQLAQIFEDHLRSNLKQEKIGNELELLLFSLKRDAVNGEFTKIERDQIQPTNLIMLKRNQTYVDLTSAFAEAMKAPTLSMRALWSELLNAFNLYYQYKIAAENMIYRKFTGKNKHEDADIFREVRFVEIHSVDQVELKESWYLSLKATFVNTRSRKNQSHVILDNQPVTESATDSRWGLTTSQFVPMTIQLNLPKEKAADLSKVNLHIQLRPDSSYEEAAKVSGIIRANSQISRFKINFSSEEKPRSVKLSVRYGDNSLMLSPARIDEIKDNTYSAEFEIDSELYQNNMALIADTILVNFKKTLFLDRMLNLNGSTESSFFNPAPTSNAIVPGTLGIWGIEDGKPVLATEFNYGAPVYLAFNGHHQKLFNVNPKQVTLEFQLRHLQPIREIRFHYKRQSMEIDPENEKPNADGFNTAKSIIKKDTHEIISIKGKELLTRLLPQGTQGYGAQFEIPLEAFDRSREEVAKKRFIYIMSPMMFEIVTEKLQTFRHYFETKKDGEKSECEKMMDDIETLNAM